jgi:uncharacterized membrane protein
MSGHIQGDEAHAQGIAPVAPVLERNIDALIARRKAEDANKTLQDRIADVITGFTGSMKFVYLHVLIFGAWIIVNLGLTPLPRFDPSFVILAMFASVEAIFLSTFVLISQNRMAVLNDKRADLDLQISLLAEYEVTETLNLVVQIAEKLGIQRAQEPELQQLGQKVDPEAVLDHLDAQEKRIQNHAAS